MLWTDTAAEEHFCKDLPRLQEALVERGVRAPNGPTRPSGNDPSPSHLGGQSKLPDANAARSLLPNERGNGRDFQPASELGARGRDPVAGLRTLPPLGQCPRSILRWQRGGSSGELQVLRYVPRLLAESLTKRSDLSRSVLTSPSGDCDVSAWRLSAERAENLIGGSLADIAPAGSLDGLGDLIERVAKSRPTDGPHHRVGLSPCS